MSFNPLEAIVQFFIQGVGLLVLGGIAIKVSRAMAKPRGTYGDGLPERRKRPRIVLPDPATLRPLPVASADAE